jgi:uncharacterized protein (TIGR00725 family)
MNQNEPSKIKICVSGAAETGHCGINVVELGEELGREIIRQGASLTTGATTGFPYYAAIGAKKENGVSIGFSPAASEKEHVEVYDLPIDYMDVIVYTGFGFPGRDLLLTRASDAVIVGCGRIGTIHEFAVAFEDGKPIGVLQGEWLTDEELDIILKNSNLNHDQVVFDSDPKTLVEKVIALVKKQKIQHPNRVYVNHDGVPKGKEAEVIL